MKRRTHRHSHRRVSRPAVFKQQVKRKEARKLAKYPLKTVYVLTQGFISLRIEVHNMPNTTSTYEPLVLLTRQICRRRNGWNIAAGDRRK